MNIQSHRQLANDIWSICNLLRGPYKRNEYCKDIPPLTERYKATGYAFYNLSKQELAAIGGEFAA